MSDRIGVMNKGRFVQIGTPNQIYGNPTNRFVSEFMGEVNVLDVELGLTGGLIDKSTRSHLPVAQWRYRVSRGRTRHPPRRHPLSGSPG